jgi:hypothetical protein
MSSVIMQLEGKSRNYQTIFQSEENRSKYPSISFLMYDVMSQYRF